MKQCVFVVFVLATLLFPSSVSAQASVGGWNPKRVQEAQETISLFKEKDSGLRAFFSEAYGFAVFPKIGKGAIGIGGARGKGVLFEQGTPIGEATMTQVTIGFQFGGQAYSEVVFFEDKAALDSFKSNKLKLSAQASAVAVTAGASADAAYSSGVAVFTMTKGGLMYEASIGGQQFKFKAK